MYSFAESEFIITRSFRVVPEARDVSSANPQPELTTFDAWELSRTISPRPTVRVANVDDTGATVNSYPPQGVTNLEAEAPARPWAMYLTDSSRLYRFLCFDLDGKTAETAAAAENDAAELAQLLRDAGLSPVVCQSGPQGGRHIWVALAEGVSPELVHGLAESAKTLHPTVDLSSIMNAQAGCVRPPGAPHRAGGRSVVLSGDLSSLTNPTGTAAQIAVVAGRLARLVNDYAASRFDSEAETVSAAQDDDKHPFIPGVRHTLPRAARAALHTNTAGQDASAVLWRILTSAAAAHWRHRDIAELVPSMPGLEHIRTVNQNGRRVPRAADDRVVLLRRQWDRAVTYVSSGHRVAGSDVTFDDRAEAIATLVREVQVRADASTGRWVRGSGPGDRRVLDGLSVLALQAVRADVEADVRRLALMVGTNRETVRVALLRLQDEGWIIRTREARGPHGAHWKIGPRVAIHRDTGDELSQAPTAPRGTGAAARNSLLIKLTDRMEAAAHDLFSRRGLGLHAGNTYARCSTDPLPLATLAYLVGDDAARTVQTLTELTEVGVILLSRDGWRMAGAELRDAAAARKGVTGVLARRADEYRAEREVWALWQAELEWMHTPPAQRPKRQALGQGQLFTDLGPAPLPVYPRSADGRANHQRARSLIDQVPATPTSMPVAVTDAERLIVEILGGVPVDTLPVSSAARIQSPNAIGGTRHQLAQSNRPESGRVRFVEAS